MHHAQSNNAYGKEGSFILYDPSVVPGRTSKYCLRKMNTDILLANWFNSDGSSCMNNF